MNFFAHEVHITVSLFLFCMCSRVSRRTNAVRCTVALASWQLCSAFYLQQQTRPLHPLQLNIQRLSVQVTAADRIIRTTKRYGLVGNMEDIHYVMYAADAARRAGLSQAHKPQPQGSKGPCTKGGDSNTRGKWTSDDGLRHDEVCVGHLCVRSISPYLVQ